MGLILYHIQGQSSSGGPRIILMTDSFSKLNMIFYQNDVEIINYFFYVDAYKIGSFKLEGLSEGEYDLVCELDNEYLLKDKFRYRLSPRKLAFVSCDLLETRGVDDPWTALKDRDVIVHLGDNIYADPAYILLTRWIKRENPSDDDIYKETIRLYESRYLASFNWWSKVAGRVQHLMGIDDHEITDKAHYNWDNLSIPLRNGAMDAYDNCQSIITGDIVRKEENGRYWMKRFENLQLLFLDRPFGTREAYRKKGLDLIKDDDEDMILIVSMGVAPFIPPYMGMVYTTPNVPEYDDTFPELFDFVFKWTRRVGGRKVLVIGGDHHFSCYGEVNYKDEQLEGGSKVYFASSSPVGTQPMNGEYRNYLSLYGKVIKSGDYNLCVKSITSRRSYVEVDLPDPKDPDSDMRICIIESNYSRPKYIIDTLAYAITAATFQHN
jgi:hypothetical protein